MIDHLDELDKKLIRAAADVLAKNYHPSRHQVGAAVLCSSGQIYTAVNVEACGYGPCAEPIALGAAISNCEREFERIVAVYKQDDLYPVISPCGNCRQLLLDYAPQALVIVDNDGVIAKMSARDLLPGAYSSSFEPY